MSFTQGLAKIKENEENRAKPTPIAMVAPELKQYMDDTEITKTCAVLGCEESKNLNSDSFFRFPEDLSLRQIWTDLTGRNNWTPTDFSYICVQHFSVDCFECDTTDTVVLNSKAVPSLKLPKHVLEVEYIDEETLDNEYEDEEDYEMESDAGTDTKYEFDNTENTVDKEEVFSSKHLTNGSIHKYTEQPASSSAMAKIDTNKAWEIFTGKITETSRVHQLSDKKILRNKIKDFPSNKKLDLSKNKKIPSNKITQSSKNQEEDNIELLKLFTEVQKMQRQAVNLKDKLKTSMRIYKRQSRFLTRIKEVIDMKKSLLSQKRKKKSRILLSLQDKMREDTNGLVLAMPTRHTDDLKNFALSVYKYSPQAYIYIRNTLRTLLPSTDVLESWVSSGFEPKNMLSNSNLIKVVSELTDSELTCKVSLS